MIQDKTIFDGLDLGCMITEKNAYDNNAVMIFVDEEDFQKYTNNAVAMRNLLHAQNEDLPPIISAIVLTQRLQYVYPLFSFKELEKFRMLIWRGIVEEMEAKFTSEESIDNAFLEFVAEEKNRCETLRAGVK